MNYTVDSISVTADDFSGALNNGQLSLAYQPIIEMKRGKIVGFEAFMRWDHPLHGNIPPGIFIPVAEESGLIVAASRWALKEACRALKRLSGALGYDNTLFMSVNFSATDLDDSNFLEQIYTVISAVDIDPSRVHVEITEKLLDQNTEQAREILGLCRTAGLGVSIDDFNTESSSLNHIHSFGINMVKIDQITDRSVGRIIDDAHALGMMTTAEGVESEEDAAMLRAMGCDYAQGYYFARPMAEKDTIDMLRGWHLQTA